MVSVSKILLKRVVGLARKLEIMKGLERGQ
jgi:hypothetical protein